MGVAFTRRVTTLLRKLGPVTTRPKYSTPLGVMTAYGAEDDRVFVNCAGYPTMAEAGSWEAFREGAVSREVETIAVLLEEGLVASTPVEWHKGPGGWYLTKPLGGFYVHQ